MKDTTIEITLDGHACIRWTGQMDAAGRAELQRRWDDFMRGDEKTFETCRARFENGVYFRKIAT